MLKRTSAEEIRRVLAGRIIAGDLRPGTPLDETQLAAEFGVSRTPVREALRLLAASRLVDQKAHAKTLVAQPDAAELAGMFEVMGYLEALCAGLCTVMMNAIEREALDALHQEMAAIVHAGDAGRYAEANDAFHTAIYDGAHNPYLSEITRSTRQRLQPFRRAQFGALGRLAQSHAEHELILEAILRGERLEAEASMRRHISSVGDAYQRLTRS
jgi:DNA-binding GntR family transcriptional regulator